MVSKISNLSYLGVVAGIIMLYDADYWWSGLYLTMTGFAFWMFLFIASWSVGFIIDLVKKSVK